MDIAWLADRLSNCGDSPPAACRDRLDVGAEAWRLILPGGFIALRPSFSEGCFSPSRVFSFGKKPCDLFAGPDGFHSTREPILLTRKDGPNLFPAPHHPHEMHFQSEMEVDVIPTGNHPCPKPMGLRRYVIDHFLTPGAFALVYPSFRRPQRVAWYRRRD